MDFRNYKNNLKESAWLLGICEQGYDDLLAGQVHWISNGKYQGKKWFADPFILDYDEERIVLLVEEFDYKVHRGRIARLFVDRKKWTVTDCKIILDLETHLSFPLIWREGNEIYVLPENYKSGGWNMYRYDVIEEQLSFVQQIMKEKLTDATLFKNNDELFILSTYIPTPNGNKLTIWKGDSLTSEYEKHQEYEFDENIARNAGSIFKWNDRLIRPTQECNNSYGHAITFQEVFIEKNGMMSFKEINRYISAHPQYKYGTHTFNQHSNGMAVIDVKGWHHPFMGPLIKGIGNLFVKLGLKKAYVLK